MGIVEIPVFTGQDVRSWLDWMESRFYMCEYNDLEKLWFAHGFIDGEAEVFCRCREASTIFESWQEMKETLLFRFGDDDDQEKIRLKIESDRCNNFILKSDPWKRLGDPKVRTERQRSLAVEERNIAMKKIDLHKSVNVLRRNEVSESSQYQTQVPLLNMEQNRKNFQLGYRADDVNVANGDNLIQESELPMFDGTNATKWIVQADWFFRFFEDESKLDLISLYLEETPRRWFYREIHRRRIKDWNYFKHKLLARFGKVHNCSPEKVLLKESLAEIKHELDLTSEVAASNCVKKVDPLLDYENIQRINLEQDLMQIPNSKSSIQIHQYTLNQNKEVIQEKDSGWREAGNQSEAVLEDEPTSTTAVAPEAELDNLVLKKNSVVSGFEDLVQPKVSSNEEESHEIYGVCDSLMMQDLGVLHSEELHYIFSLSELYVKEEVINQKELQDCNDNSRLWVCATDSIHFLQLQPGSVMDVDQHKAYQMSDELLLRRFRLQPRRKMRLFPKTWRFKFKRSKHKEAMLCADHKLLKASKVEAKEVIRELRHFPDDWFSTMNILEFWRKIETEKLQVVSEQTKCFSLHSAISVSDFQNCQHTITDFCINERSLIQQAQEWKTTVGTWSHLFTDEKCELFTRLQGQDLLCGSIFILHISQFNFFLDFDWEKKLLSGTVRRQHALCMRQILHALPQSTITNGDFDVKHSWRFKTVKLLNVAEQLVNVTTECASVLHFRDEAIFIQQISSPRHVLELREVIGQWFCFEVQPHRFLQRSSSLIFPSSSLRTSLSSREGVYKRLFTCGLIVEVLIWFFPALNTSDLLKNNVRRQKEKDVPSTHLLHQVLIQQRQKLKKSYKTRMFKYKERTRQGQFSLLHVVCDLWSIFCLTWHRWRRKGYHTCDSVVVGVLEWPDIGLCGGGCIEAVHISLRFCFPWYSHKSVNANSRAQHVILTKLEGKLVFLGESIDRHRLSYFRASKCDADVDKRVEGKRDSGWVRGSAVRRIWGSSSRKAKYKGGELVLREACLFV